MTGFPIAGSITVKVRNFRGYNIWDLLQLKVWTMKKISAFFPLAAICLPVSSIAKVESAIPKRVDARVCKPLIQP